MLTSKFSALKSIIVFAILSTTILLTACTPEHNVRGVPDTTWQQLTPEQKQLIIDQSFQHDMNASANQEHKTQ
jgi:hypothetical protein